MVTPPLSKYTYLTFVSTCLPTDYYGDEDMDVMNTGDGVTDASFQQDPEHYEFACLSTEETWNFLDAQTREVSKEIKVHVGVIYSKMQGFWWSGYWDRTATCS